MGQSLIPKARIGVPESELTWNELFYLCLQKNIWLIIAGIILVALIVFFIALGKFTDIMDLVVIIIMSVGITYIPIAFPVSIIFACVKKAKYSKKD